MLSNFENFRQRMDNKMFFFVENTPGTFVRDKKIRMKRVRGVCTQEYNSVNNFYVGIRDRLDEVFAPWE